MRNEPLERQVRVSEVEVENILRTPTAPSAAESTLVELLTALDVRRRHRETIMIEEASARARGAARKVGHPPSA
jgi:hypothetical protein